MSESPEELAVAFANTVYAVRGRPGDAIDTAAGLRGWLHDHGQDDIPGAPGEVAAFRAVRDAIRELFAAAVANGEAPAPALEALNAASAAAPVAVALTWNGDRRAIAERRTGGRAGATRARLASAAIALLGGPLGQALRACEGPRCVQYLLQDHPRRAFCCDGCSTRARAARYYARRRSAGG